MGNSLQRVRSLHVGDMKMQEPFYSGLKMASSQLFLTLALGHYHHSFLHLLPIELYYQ